MADTTTSVMSNSVHVKYERDFIMATMIDPVYDQFIDWDPVSMGGDGGSSFQVGGLEEMNDEDTSALLPETADVDSVELEDSYLTITPKEYGRVVTTTSLARWQMYCDGGLDSKAVKLVGRNKTKTVEKAIRRRVLAGTHVMRPNSVTARTSLDTTNDLISFEFLTEVYSRAMNMGIEPIDGYGNIAVIVNPIGVADILNLDIMKSLGQYQKPELILKGEFANFAGFRFISHKLGKVYMSGGQTAQTATTMTAASDAGATSLSITAGTGLANGDYILVGTKEANLSEQCQIVSGGGTTTLTVRGFGNGIGNTGLRWAHANGSAITEAANVLGMTVVGKNSLLGKYGSDWGRGGKPVNKIGDDKLERFVSHGWKWYGGIGIHERMCVRMEVASAGHLLGDN